MREEGVAWTADQLMTFSRQTQVLLPLPPPNPPVTVTIRETRQRADASDRIRRRAAPKWKTCSDSKARTTKTDSVAFLPSCVPGLPSFTEFSLVSFLVFIECDCRVQLSNASFIFEKRELDVALLDFHCFNPVGVLRRLTLRVISIPPRLWCERLWCRFEPEHWRVVVYFFVCKPFHDFFFQFMTSFFYLFAQRQRCFQPTAGNLTPCRSKWVKPRKIKKKSEKSAHSACR